VIARRWWPACRSSHADAVTPALPHQRLGVHVLRFVVYQNVALGRSSGKIQRAVRSDFGLTIRAGERPSMVAAIAALVGPADARLLDLMRQQAAIPLDAPAWRGDGVPHWRWVFVNAVGALYLVSRSRGRKVPLALLGPDCAGGASSDFFRASSPLAVEKATCWAQLLRDSPANAKGQDAAGERTRVQRRWHALFVERGVAREQVQADPAGRERVDDQRRTRLWQCATAHWRSWHSQQLAERIKNYLDDLVVWRNDPAVDPPNNAAERALRGAVVPRKTAFGRRSTRGAQACARRRSIIMTWDRPGKAVLTIAHQDLVDARSQS